MNSERSIKLHVGIDDTDSAEGMCTTYLTCIILRKLEELGIKPLDYPRLIRLNPFARYKTRGNGALSFVVNLNSREEVELVENIVLEYVEKYAMFDGVNTNPGVIFYEGEVTDEMRQYAKSAIYSIYTIDYAEEFAKQIGARYHKFKKGRGIIGAIAAISIELTDQTFECLAYRLPENYGTKRQLDDESIFYMNEQTYPETFDNIDIEGNYAAIEPHTPCPVLYGIRGNTPEIVEKAHNMVKSYEEIQDYCIFKTNQHTDMHIQYDVKINDMVNTGCYSFDCQVTKAPHDIEGGHVFFEVSDETGMLECAAFEPTKSFRDIVRKLCVGDKLTIYGGLNDNHTLNIEKFKINEIEPQYNYKNPICECGKRMKSAGKGKGFKCPKCSKRLRDADKIKEPILRDIYLGFYEVPTEARRHLAKPIIRITTGADKVLSKKS
ncbi:TiaS agmantine-binding domain-containing protein [Methanosphaera sp.]